MYVHGGGFDNPQYMCGPVAGAYGRRDSVFTIGGKKDLGLHVPKSIGPPSYCTNLYDNDYTIAQGACAGHNVSSTNDISAIVPKTQGPPSYHTNIPDNDWDKESIATARCESVHSSGSRKSRRSSKTQSKGPPSYCTSPPPYSEVAEDPTGRPSDEQQYPWAARRASYLASWSSSATSHDPFHQ